jgi:hypothetical protein
MPLTWEIVRLAVSVAEAEIAVTIGYPATGRTVRGNSWGWVVVRAILGTPP